MPTTTRLVRSPRIKLNGASVPMGDYDAIIDLHVSRAIGIPSQLTIRFADPYFEILDAGTYEVGKEIEVGFPDTGGTLVEVFTGEIVSLGVDQRADRRDGCLLTVTALDRSHRLGRETKVRTFQKMKYSDVVGKIASEHGLKGRIEDTKVTYDYLLQTTTNYAFLDEAAFRTGFEWRVEGMDLIFKPRSRTAPIVIAYGDDILRIRARFTGASEAEQVVVRSWDPITKQKVEARQDVNQVRQEGATGGESGLGDGGRKNAKVWAGRLESASLVATSSDEATQIARALGARVATADLDVRCECIGNPYIKPGSTVQIERAGVSLSGNYYVTSVEHRFGRETDMITTFSTAAPESASIVDLLGRGDERVSPFGRLGLTIGIVTNNKDPDGVGRVRVKFPALSDQEESWWARVVTPGAGQEAGLMFMPQIGDEVLVGFEHGDLRRPFVLGGVWGAKAKPPTPADKFLAKNKVVEWGLRTANGTTWAIRSGDGPADKHIKFELPNGTKLYMGEDKTEVIAQNKSIELRSGNASILITDQGDIVLKGKSIKLSATQDVAVEGLKIASKARTDLVAEGAANVQIKGGAMASFEASGAAQIKGSIVKIQ